MRGKKLCAGIHRTKWEQSHLAGTRSPQMVVEVPSVPRLFAPASTHCPSIGSGQGPRLGLARESESTTSAHAPQDSGSRCGCFPGCLDNLSPVPSQFQPPHPSYDIDLELPLQFFITPSSWLLHVCSSSSPAAIARRCWPVALRRRCIPELTADNAIFTEKIRTPITDLFGLKHPILLAGMNVAAGPKLAAAVTNAGGMGVLGGISYTPDMLRDQIGELKSHLVDKNGPFGVDLLLPQVGGSARKTK